MKSIYIILAIFTMACFCKPDLYAGYFQPEDTISFHVSGVCGSCKQRIENAALIKGVKWAQWDIESQILTVIYRKDKVTPDAIHQSIALAGHDTDKVKATDEAYKKLPRCCAYRDGVEKH